MLCSTLYKASIAKTDRVSQYVQDNISDMVKFQILSDTNLVRQFAAIHNDKIMVLTRTIIQSDTMAVAAWGDKTDLHCSPVSYNPLQLRETFVSLTPKASAELFKIPVSTEQDPVSMDPGVGSDQPGPDRLKFPFVTDEESPVIAVFPLLLPIPSGVTFPTDKLITDLKDEDFPNYPFAMQWINAVNYIIKNNGGNSLSAQDGLFKKDEIESHEAHPATSVNIPAPVMLSPDDESYHLVANAIRDDITEANAPEPETNMAPTPGQAPPQPAQTASIAKALVDALNNSNLGKAPESKSDVESNKDFNDTLIKYQLFFAIRNAVVDPNTGREETPVVSYPQISEEFKEVLRASKLQNKTATMQDLMEAHLGTIRNHSDSYLDQGTTLKSAMFDNVLTGSICSFLWSTKPLASDLDSIKSRINPFHLATPRNRSYLYKERIENGRLLQQQELAGEDDTKKERRATELYFDGQVKSHHDVQAVICNMNAFGQFMVGPQYAQTFLAKTLRHYDKVLRSSSAQVWLDQNHKIEHLAHALVLDIANQVYPFAEVASRLDYRNAIKNNKPIDPQAFVGPYEAGMQIANKLSNLVPYVHLGDYAMAPYTFELFQNKKKINEKQASDKKPNVEKRDNKRVADKKAPSSSQPEKKQKSSNSPGEKHGFLAWGGDARLPRFTICEKHAKTGKTSKLCSSNIFDNVCCKWGDKCQLLHIKSINDLEPENQKLFRKEVKANKDITWADSQSTSGTNP
jgi:hypothetical protein